MANEIVIEEYKQPPVGDHSTIGGNMVDSQYLDYGEVSAAVNELAEYIIINNKGTSEACFKIGADNTVSAVLNTAGNTPLAAGQRSDPVPVRGGEFVDNAIV